MSTAVTAKGARVNHAPGNREWLRLLLSNHAPGVYLLSSNNQLQTAAVVTLGAKFRFADDDDGVTYKLELERVWYSKLISGDRFVAEEDESVWYQSDGTKHVQLDGNSPFAQKANEDVQSHMRNFLPDVLVRRLVLRRAE